jgi:uncharacterized 2Fe-2S/4Fe-4S cluster protein (DUF4445 family)
MLPPVWAVAVRARADVEGRLGETVGDHRIVFTPSGLNGDVEHGTTVLDAARRLGVDLDTVCGGRGICGRCQVAPSTGSFAKWKITVGTDALSQPGPTEAEYSGKRPLIARHRLGCAASVMGDVVVDVPTSSQRHRQVVRKDLDLPPIVVDPLFTLWYVEVPKSELGDERTASDTVASAVVGQHGRERPTVSFEALAALQPALGVADGAVTVAIDEHCEIVAAWPGFVDAVFGVAVDVGSTTIAAHLCDLSTGDVLTSAGRMNPQIKFGEDLMSRVSYVMMNPGGDRELTAAVRGALDELLGELVDAAGVSRDRVLEVVVVGNPIMHHVLLGIDPTPLGQAPFTLATDDAITTTAARLDLDLPNGRCWVGPCIAGHVGADTSAAILAEGPHRSDTMQLLVDVGTNAEIVLGDRTRQFAASSPTGPAFEGAQISCGQRATAGAIEGVRIDVDSLEPRLKVIGAEMWSDQPGFVDATAELGIVGICGSGIIDVIAEMFLSGIIDRDGAIRGELATRTDRVVADGRTFSYVLWGDGEDRVAITQNDVRAIQLAKAALRAGIDLLVDRAGNPPIGEVRLAGAFGAHIDPLRALVLGLVPDCELEAVRAVGNSAGTGAVQALLSRTLRSEMVNVVRDVVKIETATEPRFQDLFVAAMALPHATADTTHMANHVALPEPIEPTDTGGRIRRRRRGVAQ